VWIMEGSFVLGVVGWRLFNLRRKYKVPVHTFSVCARKCNIHNIHSSLFQGKQETKP